MGSYQRALQLTIARHDQGIASGVDVERATVELLTRRMTASVQLVKALGGGWRRSDMVQAQGQPPVQPTGRSRSVSHVAEYAP